MLEYVRFEAGGFSFEHPGAWQSETLPGFNTVVCGPGMMRVYFQVVAFPDRAQEPADWMAPMKLVELVQPEALDGIVGKKTQLGEITGITIEASMLQEGDPFELYLLAVRCLQGKGVARVVLAIVAPGAILDAAGPVIQQILDSLKLEQSQWSTMRKLPAAVTSELDFASDARISPTRELPIPEEVKPSTPSPLPPVYMPTAILAESMLSDLDKYSESGEQAGLATAGQAASIDPSNFVVSTVTGGGAGFRDGPSALASFQRPNGITSDTQGNLYVADFGNHRIRRISPEGITTTLAGSMAGLRDEPGSLAMFNGPRGIVYANGYLYVADLNNAVIRRVALNGTVKTFSGNGTRGMNDGMPHQAQFDAPRAVTADAMGNLFVADGVRVRRISGDGKVQTIAGSTQGVRDGLIGQALFDTLGSISLDGAGNIYVADVGNRAIRKITRAGEVVTLPQGPMANRSGARIEEPVAVVASPEGLLYVADAADFSIKCMFPDGSVVTIAGTGEQGNRDGKGGYGDGCAEFWSPTGLTLVKNMLYVTDRDTHLIRAIRIPRPFEAAKTETAIEATPAPLAPPPSPRPVPDVTQALLGTVPFGSAPSASAPAFAPQVPPQSVQQPGVRVPVSRNAPDFLATTLAGSDVGFRDGNGEAVRFNCPMGLCVDSAGTIYVADHFNHCIRGVTNDGMVLTLAGSLESGFKDDVGTRACFKGPLGIAVGPEGNLYVSDHLNGCVRLVTIKGEVRTLAGSGTPGFRDGTGRNAQFEGPKGVAVDPAGRIWVADGVTIRCIEEDGKVTTIAGGSRGFADGRGSAAAFGWPYALALDIEGTCYVADAANHAIRRVTYDGEVTTVYGAPHLKELNFPSGIAVDLAGTIYVADTNNHRILRLDAEEHGGVKASLICGSRQGTRNGRGADAELNGPRGLGLGPGGELFVADSGAHRIVKIATSAIGVAVPGPGPKALSGIAGPAPTLDAPLDVPVPINPSAPLPTTDKPVPVSSSGNNFPTWSSEPEAPPLAPAPPFEAPPSFSSDPVPRAIRGFVKKLERDEPEPYVVHVEDTTEDVPQVTVEQVHVSIGQPSASFSHDQITVNDAPTIPAPMVKVAQPGATAPVPRRQRTPVSMFGWGLELTGPNVVKTEPDGALYLNTCQQREGSAFFFHPWEVSSEDEVVVEARMQLISYIGEPIHTGCAIWVENERYADALLIHPQGISLMRAPDLTHSMDTVSTPHTYLMVLHRQNIKVFVDGQLCLNGENRFWLRPGAKSGDVSNVRRWLAFGDGSSDAASESRWFFVKYQTGKS